MASHYTRSKAHRPGDVEPDDVARVAATVSTDAVSDTTPIRPSVLATGEPGSMATQPAGPVSVPTVPSPEARPSFGGGSELLGPAGSPPVGATLGYPSGLVGPIELVTQVRGQRMLSSPAMENTTHTTSLAVVLSGIGVPGHDAGVGTLAAADCCCSVPVVAAVSARARDGCSWRSYNTCIAYGGRVGQQRQPSQGRIVGTGGWILSGLSGRVLGATISRAHILKLFL